MRKAIAALVLAIAPLAHAECKPESADAIVLANDGDKLVSTNLDEAIAKYEQAFELAKKSPRIASKLAAAYEKKENWPKAIATLAKAFALDPHDATLFYRLGRAYERKAKLTGRADPHEDPISAYADAVFLDPNWAAPHFAWGNAADRDEVALEELTKAVQLDPYVGAHWAALADLYRRLGLMTEASKVIAEAPRFLKGDDFEFAHVAGRVHERAGEIDAAVASYESAKRACGQCNAAGQPIIYIDLARVLAAAKRTSEASANAQSFIKVICKGGAAVRYADECAQAQMLTR